jgi:ribosome-associated protein
MSDDNAPSKTQRKRRVAALQDLGGELAALNDERLATIELPERLRNAITEARRFKTFEARRRQMQYIGKLMRGVDPEPIRAALEVWRARSRSRTAALKRVEAWRERLLADPGALAALLAEHPTADAQRLRALIRNALHERAAGKPPRSFRVLYQALRTLLDEA